MTDSKIPTELELAEKKYHYLVIRESILKAAKSHRVYWPLQILLLLRDQAYIEGGYGGNSYEIPSGVVRVNLDVKTLNPTSPAKRLYSLDRVMKRLRQIHPSLFNLGVE